MTDKSKIKLNVAGVMIETSKTILMQSDYLKELLKLEDGEIFIDYDFKIFSHVLSFLRDPLYKFKSKYSHALDFFDVSYKLGNLYDKRKCENCRITFEIIHDKKLNKYYCSSCICEVNNCDNIKNINFSNSIYCIDHECYHCFELKLDRYNFCIDHKCKYCDNCFNIAVNENIIYCNNHICHGINCDKKIAHTMTKYCIDHSCEYTNCNNFKYVGKYCNYHVCDYTSNCHNLSNYIYCDDHTIECSKNIISVVMICFLILIIIKYI